MSQLDVKSVASNIKPPNKAIAKCLILFAVTAAMLVRFRLSRKAIDLSCVWTVLKPKKLKVLGALSGALLFLPKKKYNDPTIEVASTSSEHII